MKFNLKLLLLAPLALLTVTSCDIIEGPKVDPAGFTGSSNKALIEDITGHMCGNCPRAHEQAAALKATYGENLVVIAVHAGSFARVVPSLGYSTDFNTELGAALEATYHADNAGLPIGLANRRIWGGSPLTRYSDWGTLVGGILAEQPRLKIEVTPAYDPDDNSVQVAAHLEYYTAGNANHYIVALITEDSIVAKQSDYSLPSGHVDDYVHNHVLRGTITQGPWGVPVKGNDIFLGENIDLNFTSTLDSNWVPEHCHVVVYVRDNSTQEILQVEEVKLLQ